jgi:hypothetical protein
LEVFYMIRVKEWNYLRMVDFRLKGVGGKAPAKRVRTSSADHSLTQSYDMRVLSKCVSQRSSG